jgi:hypothetical protein
MSNLKLARCLVRRNLHIKRLARVAKILSNEHSTLLADEKSSGIGVAADVVGADGQISHLEALDAMYIETFVEHAVLDDAVALLGRHGAGSETVPG